MADTPFFFALEFSGRCLPASLLEQLASQALGHAGCALADFSGLAEALQHAAEPQGGANDSRGGIQFRISGGQLEVVVLADGRADWQASRPLS